MVLYINLSFGKRWFGGSQRTGVQLGSVPEYSTCSTLLDRLDSCNCKPFNISVSLALFVYICNPGTMITDSLDLNQNIFSAD